MEIAELILLLRNEVQRSYDLIDDSVSENSQSGVYISVERMEIDIPVVLSSSKKKVSVSALKKKSLIIQKFEMPFRLAAIEKKGKLDYLAKLNQAQMTGDSIHIEVINQSKKTSDVGIENIGRIKLVLKPIVK